MNRRDAVLALLALGAAPFAAVAQQSGKVWRIGVLRPAPDDAGFRQNFDPFRQALRKLGFTEGANLAIEYRVRPGTAVEILALADDLVRSKVDAIFAVASVAVSAAAKSTTSIPIVALDLESDPIAEGFAANLARPGGNVTGLFLDFPGMSGKWIQLLKESVPKLARVAVLWDPATGPTVFKGAEEAASSMRLQLLRLEVRGPADFARAFQSAAAQKAQALLVLSSPVFNSARKELAESAMKHRLPTMMPFPGFADDGGLMAYGPHLASLYGHAGGIVAKILKGARPGEIPIERPRRFELAINLKTAKALGITIPQSVLLGADRVIE
ncbi:MAG TPA: ABC transporter substrate-binding protein [Candidatus Acidoferrum sp.]|nr:ABC transporter substrate-binding protein [Candidatus Acidoferrum sp.]